MSITTKKVILAKPADWDAWFSFVRTRATNTQIWDLINPNLAVKPVSLERSTEPEFAIPDDDAQFDKVKYEAYKARKDIYKTKLARYERQEKAFGDLISFIQDTIAAHNVVFIQKEEPHPWNLLRALKKRLAPSDEARNLEIEQKYHKLCKGPGTQSIETWLDDWITTYTDGIEHEIAETTGSRPIRDFLIAARVKEPSFADAHLVMIRFNKLTYDFYGLIEDFRQHIRLQQVHQPSEGSSHSAFATGDSSPENSSSKNTASFRGQQTSFKPPCICGETHWFADCYYFVPEKRPTGWNANSTKQKKVNDALKDVQTKATVDKALQKRKDRESIKPAPSTQQPSSTSGGASTGVATTTSTNANLGSFYVKSSFSAFSVLAYPLQSSWILDNGSDTHVCNSSMLSRLTKTRLPGPDDYLTAGTQSIPIEYFGTIDITIRTPTGPQQMTLLNVAYISDFMTNIVSEDILYTKGVYFDNYNMHLHREGKTIGYAERYNGHYLLENNVLNTPQPSAQPVACASSTITATVSTERVEVSDGDDEVLKTDLAQLITEPMIDTVFDIPSLDTTAQITEIESDEESELDVETAEPIPLSKTLTETRSLQAQIAHLPTPDLTEISLPASPENSGSVSDSELSELATLTPESAEPNSGRQVTTTAARANEISATVDTANILPEGVGRTRGTHRNVSTTTLGPEPANPHRVNIDNG